MSFSFIPITEEKFNIIWFLCLKTNIIEVKFKNICFYICKQILLNTLMKFLKIFVFIFEVQPNLIFHLKMNLIVGKFDIICLF